MVRAVANSSTSRAWDTELRGHFPEAAVLKAVSQSLAVLDMIVEPKWESRYYSYAVRAWDGAAELASMRNGSGDEYSIVFLPDGAVYVRGFAHESPMSPAVNDEELYPGLIDGLPERFLRWVTEPAFMFDGVSDITSCLWTVTGEAGSWEQGTVPAIGAHDDESGGKELFALLTRPAPSQYVAFAGDYYEVDLDEAAVADIYAHQPLDIGLATRINPGRALADMLSELKATGYPAA